MFRVEMCRLEQFELSIKMLDPWYVSGFCDGEAVFTYSRMGRSFSLYFAIRQREDNRQIVEDIQQYFNFIGKIYVSKESSVTKKNDVSKASVYFRVTRIEELKIVLGHFDKYSLQSSKKRAAYNIWRQMVLYKLENYRDVDYDNIRILAEKLSELNSQTRLFKVYGR